MLQKYILLLPRKIKPFCMKYLFLFALLVGILPAQAQTFEEYLAQFPAITSAKTWQDSDIASLPTKGTKLDAQYFSFIGGGKPTTYSADKSVYPLGKIEAGNTVIVLLAVPSSSYRADYDTQISVDTYSYNKKSGKLLPVGMNFYLFSVGGDPVTNTFMYTGKLETDGKTWLKIYQTGKGSTVTHQHAYKISGKGLSFDKEF